MCKMDVFHPRICFKPHFGVFKQTEPRWISLLNGTPRKLTSLVGTAPSLDVLAFIRIVTEQGSAPKQLLLAAK